MSLYMTEISVIGRLTPNSIFHIDIDIGNVEILICEKKNRVRIL